MLITHFNYNPQHSFNISVYFTSGKRPQLPQSIIIGTHIPNEFIGRNECLINNFNYLLQK